MRAYITLPELPADGYMIPAGTVATVEPLEALERARITGDRLIYLFTAPATKPIERDGKTIRELDTRRPYRVYHADSVTVASCGSHERHPDKLRTVYAPAHVSHASL
ncbi:MAG: hypothetical protein IK099_10355 [Clostridia bacterium]|nr:hypothetical protein [Clostridia bacterium]